MKLITIFNNKGGVGKTTLLYHLAYSLSELNKKVLLLDLDPQCNLTINSLSEDKIQSIWEAVWVRLILIWWSEQSSEQQARFKFPDNDFLLGIY